MFLRFAIFSFILAQSVFAAPPAGYSLQWSDEFNGNALNTSNWNYVDNGWRNSAYNTSNAVAVSNGCLVITTYTQNGTNFTGFIDSSGKVTNSYGYYEASIQFSNAPGNWSAFWIQGPFVSNTNNNPTNGAEIDIFEHRQTDSGNNNWVNGGDHAIHWDGYVSGIEQSASYESANLGVGSGFHAYGLLWLPDKYVFSIDGTPTWTNSSFVSSAPEFIRLTSEVESNSWAGTVPGGSYPALANSPYQMQVDYVRYYAPPAPEPPQATLYVSPTGSGNNFSLAQPGNLFDARNYIRTINTNMTGDIVVYLLGGTYSFTNSFQLQENSTNHDSGNSGFNIIYENYPGQTPVISGGTLVTNWSLSDPTKNIWSAYVGAGVNSRQLYINGVRAIRARSALNPSGIATNWAIGGFSTTNTAMQNWGNVTNIEIVQRHNWKQLRCVIQSISGTNIVMQTPGWTNEAPTRTPGRPWNGNGVVSMTGVSWIENAYELLASAGMWYLNEATGYLYYIPRPGENLTNGAVVTMPVVEKLVDAQGGDITTPIHNVIFSGITFEYGTWLLPSTGSGYADNQTGIMWSGPTNALKTLGNVSFQTAANIQITNCVFLHMGGSALDFGGGAHSNVIIGNYFDDISADGISLGEVSDYAATDPNQMTDSNVIQDNFIRRPGQEYEDCIGIWLGYSENSVVAHNDVDNTPYTGISLGWGWGTATYSHNNQVLGNYVGKVMQTLTDGGSVYSLSAQTNSWHIANYYKDSCYQGIYWDEGSQWWTAVSNVFDNCIHNYINLNSSSTNTTGGILNNQNNTATNNFSNVTSVSALSRGINDVITNTTFSTKQFWPLAAQQIILQAGLEPAFAHLKSAELLVNDSEPNFDLVPNDWTYATARNYGEYHNDIHYTMTDGQAVQYTFTAVGIAWIGEMNTDESNVDVYLDGNYQTTVNCYSATRITQARLFSVTNLSAGPHTIKLVKNGGTYMILDALAVTPNQFWLTVTPNAATVAAGNTFSNMIKLDTFENFSGTTTFSASGLPSGANANFSPPSIAGAGFSLMTVSTTSNTPAGNYEVTISGVSGNVTNIANVGLIVVGSSNERWNSTASTAWDTATMNWFNLGSNAPDIFQNGDNVYFYDTAGVVTNVTIAGGLTVQPNIVTVSSSTNNFTISGAGAIGGSASLVKSGTSILNLNTTNSFTGSVTIAGGILRAGTSAALGSGGGGTTITNGGTLDVNGFNLTAEPMIISGGGVNGNGAVINSGASQISALRQVTLAGNVIFGGTNRWDIRNTGGTASLSTGGQPFNITKVGTNQVSLVAVNPIDSAFANITIQQGEFAIQTSTTQVGDATKTISVWSNATLEVWALTTPLNKQIVLSNGATFFNESGSSFVNGPLTLNGNDTFNAGGASLIFSNAISGAGNLIKTGSTNLIFAGTNNYTGNTIISNGTIFLVANGSISGSANIFLNSGTTLDASGRANQTLTLNSGQTLSGNGTVNGNATVGAGAAILPWPNGVNLVGALTITNVLTLKGATILRVDKLHGTNDVLNCAGVNFGGTLVVSNLNNAFAGGDSFKFFNAQNYSGNFSAIQPPSPGAGLAWDTTALSSGILKVGTVTQKPRIGSLSISGTNVIATGTNGTRGGAYFLLASTNVALPLANWQIVTTNLFNSNSSFTFTNALNPNSPQWFYLLQLP